MALARVPLARAAKVVVERSAPMTITRMAVLSAGSRASPASSSELVPVRAASTGASKRPLSPHLTVYSFGINMITSVIFRGTGMAMTFGVAGGSLGLLFSGAEAEPVFQMIQDNMLLKPIFKFAIAFPLSYHLMGGIRHLAWDNIWGHEIASVNQSAWAVLYGSTALAVLLTFSEWEREV